MTEALRIHVTGASGAGVSTLGQALADRFSVPHHDTDDFYWLPTSPPYRQKRAVDERLSLLRQTLGRSHAWVLSGGLMGWGDPLVPLLDVVVWLYAPTALRLARLREREQRRFGQAIAPGGEMHEQHEAFIAWAAAYDSGTAEGRSLPRHQEWLDRLPCPVLRLDSTPPVSALVAAVVRALP